MHHVKHMKDVPPGAYKLRGYRSLDYRLKPLSLKYNMLTWTKQSTHKHLVNHKDAIQTESAI